MGLEINTGELDAFNKVIDVCKSKYEMLDSIAIE